MPVQVPLVSSVRSATLRQAARSSRLLTPLAPTSARAAEPGCLTPFSPSIAHFARRGRHMAAPIARRSGLWRERPEVGSGPSKALRIDRGPILWVPVPSAGATTARRKSPDCGSTNRGSLWMRRFRMPCRRRNPRRSPPPRHPTARCFRSPRPREIGPRRSSRVGRRCRRRRAQRRLLHAHPSLADRGIGRAVHTLIGRHPARARYGQLRCC
jgi:hypothetical protein